jgi:hypothetical protein
MDEEDDEDTICFLVDEWGQRSHEHEIPIYRFVTMVY